MELAFVVGASVISLELLFFFWHYYSFQARPAITIVRNCGFYYYLLYSFNMRILPVFFSFLRQVKKGGEDAYFIKEYGGGVLGVADGVSG